MALTLTPEVLDRSMSAAPLSTQLADHLRQAIATLDLEPGAVIDGEDTIAKAVGVSRPTVRDALKALTDEGLLVRRAGARTRVAIPPSVRQVDFSRYLRTAEALRRGEEPPTAFVADHGARDEDYEVDPVEITREKATAQDAEYLRIRKGSPILRRRMIQRLGGEPIQIHRQAFPARLVKGTDLEREVRTTGGGLLAELTAAGLEPTHFEEWWTARMPNRTERELLGMLTHGPVIDMLRVFIVADDPEAEDLTYVAHKPVQVSRIISPAARNTLHVFGRL
jgi:GntR family transcriptional regulator